MVICEARSVGPLHSAATIHEQVAAVARAHPDAIALICGPHQVSYRELVVRGQAFSRQLFELDVGPGCIIPVLLSRGIDLAVALLGILGTGAAYAALDISWPASRLEQLIDSVDAPLVVTARGQQQGGRRTVAVDDLGPNLAYGLDSPWQPVDPEAVCTVFFTSGSTGAPKAVLSTHQATTRLFGPGGVLLDGPGTAMPCLAPVPWDAFTLELWGMLTTGGTSVLHDGDFFMPLDLVELVESCGVDQLWLTAGLFNVFVSEHIEAFAGLRRVLSGGERMSVPHALRFLQTYPDIELVNGYGPVETCVFASTHRVTLADVSSEGEVPVGRPVANTSIRILDGDRLLGVAETGEICVGGGGLALGYHGRPDLTERDFSELAVGQSGSERLYRTGDLGLIDSDGLLHYRGRADRQVKVAGHRIEPGEVEAVALRCGAAQSAVLAIPAPTGIAGLALFAVPGSAELTRTQLRTALRKSLPAFLMPTRIELVEQLPLTANGKVDRQALAASLAGPQ